MTVTPYEAKSFAEDFTALTDNVEQAIVGKTACVRLSLACLLSGGHLLLEDNPGTGKTSLAKAIARSVRGLHRRIQFTPDLLPSDVTGGLVLDPRTGSLELRRGPVFSNILVADEINRASPKTQSALLQAMEETFVTIDGTDHRISDPFMVIATQNPIEQAGTYRLPEAQLDRFLLRTSLGYPSPAETVRLLAESATRDRSSLVREIIDLEGVVERREVAAGVHVDPAILSYIGQIAEQSRHDERIRVGVSMRGCIALARMAKTWAAAQGRHYVLPEDIIELAQPVLTHRLVLQVDAELDDVQAIDVIDDVMRKVPAPLFRNA